MKFSKVYLAIVILFAGVFIMAAGCTARRPAAVNAKPATASQAAGSPQPSAQKVLAAPAQKIPSGDIPDSQAFVTYASTSGHYQVEVPEGWARTVQGTDVTFVSKLDGLSIQLLNTLSAPTVDSIRSGPVANLEANGSAVVVTGITREVLKGNPAIKIAYESNSTPDPVTGKRVRLENNTYYYYHKGSLAELRLWAPLGADNVDQWRRMSLSFSWGK